MTRPNRNLSLSGALGLLLFLSGCTFAFVATRIPASAREDRDRCEKLPPLAHHFDRVLIVVFENQTFRNVMAKDTYFAKLVGRGRLFSNFHGLFHPSYSNYLAMVTGKEVPSSWDEQLDLDGIRTIADSLTENGLTWKNYAEAYPGRCFTGKSHGKNKDYARKHVPFLSFRSIQNDPQSCSNVVPAERQFRDDFYGRRLPHYAFYSPDMYHDGHNPPWKPSQGLREAAQFLEGFLRPLLDDTTFMDKTLTVITFDESYTILVPDRNHIYTLFLGNMVKKGVSSEYYTHYDVLRTIKENFGLPPLPNNGIPACAIEGIWIN